MLDKKKVVNMSFLHSSHKILIYSIKKLKSKKGFFNDMNR